ncbi:MAG: response regulator [Chlorobaculum sp.]|nr:response regulator [Chlorobaculum sp.]
MPNSALDFDLFKDFPEPVFVMAPDGKILAANRFFSARFESLHQHIIGHNIFDLLVEINAPQEVIDNRKAKTLEVLRIGKHVAVDDQMDDNIWRSSIYPAFDAKGNISKLLVFVQNITEKRLVEIENEDFRAKMVFALECAHVSVWSFDIENNVLTRTLEHDRIFGYDSLVPDWKIERFFGHIHPDDLQMVMGTYENAMANQSDFNIEFRIRRTDEELRWINLVGTFRFAKAGKSRHIVGIILDITEKKLAQIELEQLQTQLQQSQKMELLGQLAGGIAHDFNNSLTSIIGNIELALAKIDPSQSVATLLRSAHESALRSAHLTSQLLGFARKQIRCPEALSLNREVERIIPMMRSLISSQIECVWLPGENVPEVFIDPTQLDQVLTNLCVNAFDAIEEYGTITISTGVIRIDKEDCEKGHPCPTPGDYAVLSVSDTGSGIDSAMMPHIFEPFFTTKPIGKGAGIGLSTVYGIVKQNNGSIDCKSEPGKGTTFSIFFPKHRDEALELMLEAAAQNRNPTNNTVLLVEDESNILNILKRALEEKGYQVLEAMDAESALIIAQTHREKIDILVSDVILPRMNGIELCKQLQALLPEMKSIFMSGFPFEKTKYGEQSSKPVNFIRKPFSISDFMNLVGNELKNVNQQHYAS